MRGSVLVVGAGMAGMQASLDLVAQGFKVFLVESKPTIGGKMAQLDKMYPSGECGMCTQLPKMLEITSNPNIQLMAFCEVVGVEGSSGDFKVRILKRPRYVDPMKCTACTECFPVCPVGDVPMEFNYGRGKSKAISFYSPFPPRKAIIYPEYCTYLKEGKCGDGDVPPCVEACKPEAIVLDQKPTEVEINVGAIIVATGLDVYRPIEDSRFGYKKYKNVLTSIEFERLLSGVGPTGGSIKRDDGSAPKRIAWIQCVGSKDKRRGEDYCSAVCCMAASTEALGTLERDRESEVFVIHDDILAYAKRFQEYFRESEKEGVKYLRAGVEGVAEVENDNLALSLKKPSGEVEQLEVDMLVLSTAQIPNPDNDKLAEILGVDLDDNGFFLENESILEPMATSSEGIYVCGSAQSSKDISESVVQGSGAAALAAGLLSDAKGTELAEVEKPPEIEVKPTDEPSIGVLICHCGANVAGFMDVDELAEYAKGLQNVSVVEHDLFGCGGGVVKEMVKNDNPNRMVIAACSPKTHENLFGLHLESVGMNRYLMEMANIRNHCSWVHSTNKEETLEKAKTLINMAVARARLLEPLHKISSNVIQSCCVIGGGLGGLTCANRLADMGYDVHLVEKGAELGGMLNQINSVFMSKKSPSDVIADLSNGVKENGKITTHLNSNVTEVGGFIGQYDVRLAENGQENVLNVGTIVVATGAKEIDPTGLFGYGSNPSIITQLELEKKLKANELALGDGAEVVMISCVGSKEVGDEDKRKYCCRIGCPNIIKNAKAIKEVSPNTKVHILHRDMTLIGKGEEKERLELEGREGVEFIRYNKEKKPQVAEDMRVEVWDDDEEVEKEIIANLVVLTVPLEGPEDGQSLKELLGVQMDENGFFTESLGKLKPLDFTTDGIFLCGCAHSPKSAPEVIADAEGCASRVANIISNDIMDREPTISFVVDEKCDGCAYCIEPCTFNAITLIEYMYDGAVKKTVQANDAICKGCGNCMATCPKEGIYIRHFRPEHFESMINAALGVE